MFEKYEEFFEMYLRRLKKWYEEDDSIKKQKELCRRCEEHEQKLIGMLELMYEVKEITSQMRREEEKKVAETFYSRNLFGLYIRDGQLYECEKGQDDE